MIDRLLKSSTSPNLMTNLQKTHRKISDKLVCYCSLSLSVFLAQSEEVSILMLDYSYLGYFF